jgi:hypothetical protein
VRGRRCAVVGIFAEREGWWWVVWGVLGFGLLVGTFFSVGLAWFSSVTETVFVFPQNRESFGEVYRIAD